MRHAFNAGLLLLVSATPVAAQSMDGMMDDLRRMEPAQNLGTVLGSEDFCSLAYVKGRCATSDNPQPLPASLQVSV